VTTKEAIGVAIEVMKFRLKELRREQEWEKDKGYDDSETESMIHELADAIAVLKETQ
jgi:hypothetical protein